MAQSAVGTGRLIAHGTEYWRRWTENAKVSTKCLFCRQPYRIFKNVRGDSGIIFQHKVWRPSGHNANEGANKSNTCRFQHSRFVWLCMAPLWLQSTRNYSENKAGLTWNVCCGLPNTGALDSTQKTQTKFEEATKEARTLRPDCSWLVSQRAGIDSLVRP